MFTGFVAIFIFPTVKDGIISQNMKKSTLCDLNYANAKKYSYKAYTGTVAYIPYLYDTEVNEDGSVLSGKIGIEYVDAPNIFPVTWKNGEVSECIFAFGWAGSSESSRAKSGDGVIWEMNIRKRSPARQTGRLTG